MAPAAAATAPVALTLEEDETEYFEGKITLPAKGPWTLRFDVRGRAGSGTILVPVTVVAP